VNCHFQSKFSLLFATADRKRIVVPNFLATGVASMPVEEAPPLMSSRSPLWMLNAGN
jgi:hypothetical protein